jgi:hypothetical protein
VRCILSIGPARRSRTDQDLRLDAVANYDSS